MGNSTALLGECYAYHLWNWRMAVTLSSPRADRGIRVRPAAECTWISP